MKNCGNLVKICYVYCKCFHSEIGAAAAAPAAASTDIGQQRRRLSVMSDNKLIEGMEGVNVDDYQPAAGTEVSLNTINGILYFYFFSVQLFIKFPIDFNLKK